MALNTKTAAAGITAIGGAAGTGVAIQQLTKETWTVKQQLEKDGYELVSENSDWDALIKASLKNGTPSENQKKSYKKECEKLLVEIYSETGEQTDYQKAVKKCTKLLNLKEISEKEGKVILTKDYEKTLNAKWKDNSEAKTALTNTNNGLQAVNINGTTTEEELTKAISNCNKYSQKHNRFSDTHTEELNNYQTLCTSTISKETSPKEKSYWKAMTDASFTVLKMDGTDDSNWLTVYGKNYTNKSHITDNREKINLIKIECDTLRQKTSESAITSETADYKDAVKKCTLPSKLKDRAKAWGFEPLNSSDSNSEGWSAKVSGTKNNLDKTNGSGTKNASTLAASCKAEEEKDHFSTDLDTNWNDYLKGCMKENVPTGQTGLESKKYWTKKES